MAFPAVGTRVGGVPELITDKVDGFVEAVGDIEAQSQRVLELITDPGLHSRMAAQARTSACERFATERIIPQYEAAYNELCEGC